MKTNTAQFEKDKNEVKEVKDILEKINPLEDKKCQLYIVNNKDGKNKEEINSLLKQIDELVRKINILTTKVEENKN